MKKSILITSALLMSVFMVIAEEMSANEKVKKARTQEERQKAFREQFEQLIPVTIYGKVVDQNDNPVSGANVRISWERATYLIGKADHGRDDWVKSEADGCFTFICDHPHRAFADASKDGYEASQGASGNLIWNRTDKTNPVVLRIRKKGPTTFLVVSPSADRLPSELSQTKGTNNLIQAFDLFTWDADTGWRHCATPNADLRIDASFDAEKKSWIVTYAVTNGVGGLIFSDSLFYEAPETGYVPQATVTVTNQEQDCYLYLKSRTPAVYSRILFNHRYNNRGDQSLRLYCKAWINPYGERNLEYDNSLEASWRVVDELKAEAKQAIHAKKLPPKPDIPQRIKATSERVAREKAESDKRHKEWVEQQKKQKE